MNDPFLPEDLRLFVACELPKPWLEALRQAMHDLSRTGLGHLRWVRPEGIHLTLKFLGDVGRHLLPDLQTAMEGACTGRTPFEVRLAGLGTFGGRGRTRIVWAGIAGNLEALGQLHAAVDSGMSNYGFARDTRPFAPHLTLARVPDDAPNDSGARIAAALRTVHLPSLDPMSVDEISLIRSQLGRGGASYTRLASALIGPARTQD